jgi:mRNA-degrading endonuclease RelE of RelBE toxin-antitoxin system
MIYKIAAIANFRKEAKKLIKKYPSLVKELDEIGDELSTNPALGTSIGSNCFKIRLSIASKGRGKSGGARLITYVYVTGTTVFLLSIYDKSEKSSISDGELKELLKQVEF